MSPRLADKPKRHASIFDVLGISHRGYGPWEYVKRVWKRCRRRP